jgi:hypothetical protein
MVSERSEGVSIHVDAGETQDDIKRWAAEDEAKAKADAEAKAQAAATGAPQPAAKRSLGGLSARAALTAKKVTHV